MRSRRFLGLPKGAATTILLAFALALTLRMFHYVPGMAMADNLWIAAAVLYLVGPYLLSKLHTGFAIPPFELYVIFIIVVMPFVASLAALNVFAQPTYYGIGSQRSVVLCAWALALIHACRRGLFEIKHVESAFIFLAWGSLFVYTAVTVLVNPESKLGDGTFIKGGIIEEAFFNFNVIFIIFGFLYYVMSGFMRKNIAQYFLAVPFLIYIIVVDMGRMRLLAMLLSVVICVVRYGTFKRVRFFSIWSSVVVILIGLFFYLFDADFAASRLTKFADAFKVLVTGEVGSDVSANQRIYESLTAMPYILEHWLIGAGRISSQWNGGYSGVIGSYFYPSDIGMLGAFFMYGLFGCMIYAIQFYFAWRNAKSIPKNHQHFIFLASIVGCLWYYALHSLTAGLFVHFIETGILMGAILYVAAFLERHTQTSAV